MVAGWREGSYRGLVREEQGLLVVTFVDWGNTDVMRLGEARVTPRGRWRCPSSPSGGSRMPRSSSPPRCRLVRAVPGWPAHLAAAGYRAEFTCTSLEADTAVMEPVGVARDADTAAMELPGTDMLGDPALTWVGEEAEYEFPLGEEVQVRLAFVERPWRVWVVRAADLAARRQVELLLDEAGALATLPQAAAGQLAVARAQEDGGLGRVRVLHTTGEIVTVRFIDYGNCEEKVAAEVLVVPSAVASLPALAAAVEVAALGGNTEEAREAVYGLLDNKELDMTVGTDHKAVFSVQGEQVLPEVTEEMKEDLMEALKVKKEEALEIIREEETVVAKEVAIIKPEIFPEDPAQELDVAASATAVTVSHVESGSVVWVTPSHRQEELAALVEEVAALRPRLAVAAACGRGATVAAEYSGDGEVYRARVEAVLPGTALSLLFIDFGNSETKESREVLELPAHLQEDRVPGVAERVVVAGVEGDREEVRRRLEELVETEEQVTMVRREEGEVKLLVGGAGLHLGRGAELPPGHQDSPGGAQGALAPSPSTNTAPCTSLPPPPTPLSEEQELSSTTTPTQVTVELPTSTNCPLLPSTSPHNLTPLNYIFLF